MQQYRIGQAARLTGLSPHSIRFYEHRGLLPPALRSEGGYRLYSERDLRRLRLIRNLRRLDLPVDETAAIVDEAFGSQCGHYLRQLGAVLDRQRATVRQRLVELQALVADLEALRGEAEAAAAAAPDGSLVAECPCCPLIDDGAGQSAYCGPPAAEGPTHGTRWEKATDELLEILTCDLAARPPAAPGPAALATFVREVSQSPGELVVTFDPAAAAAVMEFVDAEQHCCGQLEFAVTRSGEAIRLMVRGAAAQTAAFGSLWG